MITERLDTEGSLSLFNDLKRLKTIADIGLLYAKDGYDTERYEKTLGAFHFGGRVMIIETNAALKLINKYF